MKAPLEAIVAEAARIYAIARPHPEKRLTDAECRVMTRLEHEYLAALGVDYQVHDGYGRLVSGAHNWYTIERPAGMHPGGIFASSPEEALLRVTVWPDRRNALSVFLDPDCVRYKEMSAEWTAAEKRAAKLAKVGAGDLLAMLGDWDG